MSTAHGLFSQTGASGGLPAGDPRPRPVPAPASTAATSRVALVYAVTGDLRYLAHQDELRMLTRALVRAGWPLLYRGGFNPRPRVVIPLPRNLGTSAACQLALADLEGPAAPAELWAAVGRQMPAACPVLALHAGLGQANVHPLRVTYQVTLDAADIDGLHQRVRALLERAAVVAVRDCGPRKSARRIDIRPHVEALCLDGGNLRMTLRFVEQRIARPTEIITELGLSAQRYLMRIERQAVQWDLPLTRPAFGPGSERKE